MSSERKERVDKLLVIRGLVESREKAQRLISAGLVKCEDIILRSPSQRVPVSSKLELIQLPKYVSRGGDKLEPVIRWLIGKGFDLSSTTCLDVGASTGGFTDCLLQHGASLVFALDVGKHQLHWKLRTDPRVKVIEGYNARYINPEDYRVLIGRQVHLITVDVSFISLNLILRALTGTLKQLISETYLRSFPLIIALIKPQFELSRAEVRGGKVRSAEGVLKAVRKVLSEVRELGLKLAYLSPSPIRGAKKGNLEVFSILFGEPTVFDLPELSTDEALGELEMKLMEGGT